MFTNPWFVGICTGIVSGIIVFLISNKISRKDYYKKVKQANEEIVALLIITISEGKIPSLKIIKSVLSSLSRKYGVKPQNMNNAKETLEDMIKEVFATNFIPMDKKIELSEQLAKLIKEEVDYQTRQEIADTGGNLRNSELTLPLSIILLSFPLLSISGVVKIWSDRFDFGTNYFVLVSLITMITLSIVVTLLTLLSKKKQNENLQKDLLSKISNPELPSMKKGDK
ncbi:hypothetical protein [Sporosarcina ureilytica]|uniref:Uncharacterized protein n=1 Tax=Sporosarcina ureilytica TaxID=298596 RepID=A0A1D8JGS6_9BACL|nr:hypothetical protein [Sporosarcina ureilytica]AOV07898.1 hypothetical protein BI350_10360 [Sporosarcina ureilytica]